MGGVSFDIGISVDDYKLSVTEHADCAIRDGNVR